MITLIITILFLQQFLMYLTGAKPGVLCCGIWCYNGNTPPDSWKLKILSLYNQSRGDHATGICIDNEIVKETTNAREFIAANAEFFDLINEEMSNYSILGHCRQATASYAKDNINFAHPHSILKNATDETPFLFGVHNGTITNMWDLTDKYNLDYNNAKYSDSILFFTMLTRLWDGKNMDILKEYEGSATVVFYPANAKNILYVHRDKARELYYWPETENSCYISSIKDSLLAIGAKKEEVIEFEEGMLFKFCNGHITKKWDLKDKKPYQRPRKTNVVNFHNKHSHVPARQSQPEEEIKNTNGFVWKDHRIYFNGHMYTGQLFYNKKKDTAERWVLKSERVGYEEYHCIMGLVMKDLKAYEELYKLCTIQDKFSADLFKKKLANDLQPYVLYPYLGKSYTETGDFFWHDAFKDIKVDQVYKWTPILSKTEFTCSRAGLLKSQLKLTTSQEDLHLTFLRTVIEERAKSEDPEVTGLNGIFNAYAELVKPSRLNTLFRSWDNFLTYLIEVLRDYNYCSATSLNNAERSRNEDDFYGGMLGVDYMAVSNLTDALNETLKALADLEEPVEDISSNLETLELSETLEDINYYDTQDFRDKVLFGQYDTIDDIMADYLITDEQTYAMGLFKAIAKVLKQIGLITQQEIDKFEEKGTVGTKLCLGRIYDDLRQETALKQFFSIFEGSEKDLVDGYAELYKLHQKCSNADKDKPTKEILALGLKYLSSTKKVNGKKLLEQHNISIKETENVY